MYNKFHRYWRHSAQVLQSDDTNNIMFWQGSRSSTGSIVGADGDYSPSRVLAPPMPPIAPQPKLRRINSSTLSLNKHKRKMLTVILMTTTSSYYYRDSFD